MKKALIVFLLLALGAQLIFLPAAAAESVRGKVSFAVQSAEWERGGSVELVLELNRNPGFVSLRVCVSFPEEVFEVEEASLLPLLPAESQPEMIPGAGLVFRFRAENKTRDLTATGRLGRVRLRIRSDAPYGSGEIGAAFSERLFDVQNAAGKAVPFDAEPLAFTLVCPHKNRETNVESPATFSKPGKAREICLDCGEEREKSLLPVLRSEDGNTVAEIPCGVLRDDAQNTVKTEYIYGGREASLAKTLFGEAVVRAWRVRFFSDGKRIIPTGDIHVTLTPEFSLPENFSLYRIRTADAVKTALTVRDGAVTFSFSDDLYVLVREESGRAALPDMLPVVTEAPDEVPPATLSPEETKRRKDRLILGGIALFMLLSGALAVALLRKGRQD